MDATSRARVLALAGIVEFRATAADAGGGGGTGGKTAHEPAGSPKGGQFTGRPGSGGSKATNRPRPKKKAAARAPQNVPQAPATPRLVKQGDSGEDVRYAQYAMSLLGFKVAQDGRFGPETAAAVEQMQQRLGVKHPNGHITPALLHKMQDAVRLSPCVGGQRDLAFESLWEQRDDGFEDGDLDFDETAEAVLDALAEFERSAAGDWAERAAHDVSKELRIPSGKGGGRWTKNPVTSAIAHALEAWSKGDGPDDPFVFDGKPIDREPLRKAAVARGITLKRGASRDDIVKALMDDVKVKRAGAKAPDAGKPVRFTLTGGKPDAAKVREVEVENKIRAAYRDLQRRPGDWVPIADLRDRLSSRNLGAPGSDQLTRRNIDEALMRMAVQPGSHVIPWDNTKALTDRDRLAAVRIGGQWSHAVRLEDPSPRPVPNPDSKLRNLDVGVFTEPSGKLSLWEVSDSGERRRRVALVDDLAGLEKWANDNGETHLADWARKERGGGLRSSGSRVVGRDLTGDLDYGSIANIPYVSGEGDSELAHIWARQGFDGPPRIVDDAEWKRLAGSGGRPMHRGVRGLKGGPSAGEFADRYTTGGHHPGIGIFGNGAYFVDSPGTAGKYSTGEAYGPLAFNRGKDAFEGSAVIEAMLLPDARVLEWNDLEGIRESLGLPATFSNAGADGDPRQLVLGDPGRLASALGYDAIRIDTGDGSGGYGNEVLVLNRTATAVRRPDGPGSLSTPGRDRGPASGVDVGTAPRDQGRPAGGDLGSAPGGRQTAPGRNRGQANSLTPAKATPAAKKAAPAAAPVDLAHLRTLDREVARDELDLRKLPELKALLRKQKLPVSGRKRDLVDRLVEHTHGGGTAPPATPAPTVPGQPAKAVGKDISPEVDYESLPTEYNHATNRDEALKAILQRQGFDGRPQVVSRAEFDAALKRGDVRETWRGVKDSPFAKDLTPAQMAEEYRTGDLHAGIGINGNGTYVAARRADGEYYGTTLLRIGLRKDARIISAENLDREMDAYFEASKAQTAKHQEIQRAMLAELAKARTATARANIRRRYYQSEFYAPDRASRLLAIQRDPGRFAALRGYDAIDIPKERSPDKHAEMIILNRTATIVQAAE